MLKSLRNYSILFKDEIIWALNCFKLNALLLRIRIKYFFELVKSINTYNESKNFNFSDSTNQIDDEQQQHRLKLRRQISVRRRQEAGTASDATP
jgi:hypothetical protein